MKNAKPSSQATRVFFWKTPHTTIIIYYLLFYGKKLERGGGVNLIHQLKNVSLFYDVSHGI